jgi:hypothetical protein
MFGIHLGKQVAHTATRYQSALQFQSRLGTSHPPQGVPGTYRDWKKTMSELYVTPFPQCIFVTLCACTCCGRGGSSTTVSCSSLTAGSRGFFARRIPAWTLTGWRGCAMLRCKKRATRTLARAGRRAHRRRRCSSRRRSHGMRRIAWRVGVGDKTFGAFMIRNRGKRKVGLRFGLKKKDLCYKSFLLVKNILVSGFTVHAPFMRCARGSCTCARNMKTRPNHNTRHDG